MYKIGLGPKMLFPAIDVSILNLQFGLPYTPAWILYVPFCCSKVHNLSDIYCKVATLLGDKRRHQVGVRRPLDDFENISSDLRKPRSSFLSPR